MDLNYELKLNASEETARYLRQFAALQFPGSPDNLGTKHPFHIVQSYVPEYVIDVDEDSWEMEFAYAHGSFPHAEYFNSPTDAILDCYGYSSVEAYNEAVAAGEQSGPKLVPWDDSWRHYYHEIELGNGDTVYINDSKGYAAIYGIRGDDDWHVIGVIPRWRDKSIHFTLNEAKRYMEYQGHNLTNGRTYTDGAGYGDKGDYVPMWEFLYQAGIAALEAKEALHWRFDNLGLQKCMTAVGIEIVPDKQEILSHAVTVSVREHQSRILTFFDYVCCSWQTGKPVGEKISIPGFYSKDELLNADIEEREAMMKRVLRYFAYKNFQI